MSKNKLTIQVTVVQQGLMPEQNEVTDWLAEQYARAIEMAQRANDGTVTSFKAEFPCLQVEKE